MCKSAIKKMLKNKSGKIINITSVVGHTGNLGQANYTASKAGIIAMSKSLAIEYAKKNNIEFDAKKFIDQDMVDLFEKYPWLPKPPAVMEQIFSKGSGMTQEDILKRAYKGFFPDIKERHTYGGHVRETKGNPFKQILVDIFGPDDR